MIYRLKWCRYYVFWRCAAADILDEPMLCSVATTLNCPTANITVQKGEIVLCPG